MALDVQLDDDGGWLLNETGDDLALITGVPEQSQSMRTQLRSQQGTSIYDPTFGLPYREQILVKAPDLNTVGAIVRGTVLQRPDVQSVPVFRIAFDDVTRRVTIEFEAVTDLGVVNSVIAL